MGRNRVSAYSDIPYAEVLDFDTSKEEASAYLTQEIAKDQAQGKSPKRYPLEALSSGHVFKKSRRIRCEVEDDSDEDDSGDDMVLSQRFPKKSRTNENRPAARKLHISDAESDKNVDMSEEAPACDFNFETLQCSSQTKNDQFLH